MELLEIRATGENGSTAPSQSLIRVVSVVAGGECANGGARIDTGLIPMETMLSKMRK